MLNSSAISWKVFSKAIWKKEERVLWKTTGLFLFALQDGLGFKKMKSLETFGNCKKLKYR